MTGWYRRDGDGALIDIRVRPNAKVSVITGPVEGENGSRALGVRLAAKPVDGAANKALTELFAREWGVAKSAIRLVAGEKGRTKRLHIAGRWADLEPRLAALAKPQKI